MAGELQANGKLSVRPSDQYRQTRLCSWVGWFPDRRISESDRDPASPDWPTTETLQPWNFETCSCI